MHPDKFYSWIGPLFSQIKKATPNSAHKSLARLESAGKLKSVITQNIDHLHQSAGSQVVIELHGSLNTSSCLACCQSFPTEPFIEPLLSGGQFPRCPDCRSILKPDITLYEEILPERAWEDALYCSSTADVFWVIGSSLEVIPAAHLPLAAVEAGARLIINNFTPTAFDRFADVLLPYDLALVVPEIVESCLERA
jgi:NAD-dependent deacetylase